MLPYRWPIFEYKLLISGKLTTQIVLHFSVDENFNSNIRIFVLEWMGIIQQKKKSVAWEMCRRLRC